MRFLLVYLKDYLRNVSLRSLILTILFTALLVFLNYTMGIEKRIRDLAPWYFSLLSFFFFYGFVLFFAWAVQYRLSGRKDIVHKDRRRFLLLMLLAPLFFAAKMVHWDLSPLLPSCWHYPWNRYALIVGQLPAKLLLLLALLYGCWKWEKNAGMQPVGFWGLTTANFKAKPYLLMLLCLLPLIALASTQHDFLHTYPKVKSIAFIGGYTRTVWPWKLLYEISYGLDFVSIELFFRGFLVIGLARYAGHYAILPMAAFYCTIHFGKPMGECISSFFGGLILGVVAWRTRSILGGLMVHLGLAWLMELGGWLGNLFF